LALCILNVLGAIVYIVIFLNLKITVSNEIAFSTPDALTYMNVMNWVAHGVDSESVSIRPILFPLMLLVSIRLGGVYGIWIIQVIFWFLTINFTFLSVRRLTKSYLLAYLGAFLILSNLSLIALTLHALTEVTITFLISAMIFFLIKKKEEYNEPHFFHTVLFFLVLLSIVKPVFFIPVLFILFVVFPLLYLKKYLKHPLSFLKLLLILVPLLIQITIIKVKYDQTKISLIGSKTFSEYFVAQGIQKIELVNYDDAVIKATRFSKSQQMDYVFKHKSTYLRLFGRNIYENITEKSTFLLFPEGYDNYQFANFMKIYNKIIFKIHFVFTILILPLLFVLLKKRNFPILILISFLFVLEAYYIIVTGISFSQGDRLTLPAIAIWACIYPFILFFYYKLLCPRSSDYVKKAI